MLHPPIAQAGMTAAYLMLIVTEHSIFHFANPVGRGFRGFIQKERSLLRELNKCGVDWNQVKKGDSKEIRNLTSSRI